MQKATFLQALLLTVGFAAMAATGCSGDPVPDPFQACQVDEDCDTEGGEICRSGVCSNSCETSSDCEGDNEICSFNGVCVSPCTVDGEESSCPSDQSCVAGPANGSDICWWDDAPRQPEACGDGEDQGSCSGAQYCANGFCISNSCEETSDCRGRNACSAGICQQACVAQGESPERLQCPPGTQCNPRTGECESEGCDEMMDCQEETKECNPGDIPCDKFCCYNGTCDPDSPSGDTTCEFYAEDHGIDIPQVCQDDGTCGNAPECMQDSDCGENEICEINEGEDERNVCRRGCRCTDGCEKECLPQQVCSFQMGQAGTCVEGCTSNQDCEFQGDGSGEAYCVEQQCIDACESNMDCETDGFACRTFDDATSQEQTVCQHCRQDSDCGTANDREFCNTERGLTDDIAENPDLGLCQDLAPLCPSDRFEPNASRGNAFLLDGSELSSPNNDNNKTFSDEPYLCSENDSAGDWFRIDSGQIGQDQVIDITVNYPQDINGGDTGNVDLALYREGESEPLVTSTGPADGGTERVVYGVQAASDFLIQVRGGIIQHPDPETGRSKEFVKYNLNVDVRDPKPCNQQNDDALEENDSRTETTIVAPDTPKTGLTVCGDDPDFYDLDAAKANQNLDISVEAPFNLGNIDLVLYKDGTKVTEAKTESSPERLRYATDDGEDLVVGVTVTNGTGLINYDFQWDQSANQCFDSLEPNNQCPPVPGPTDPNPSPSYLDRDSFISGSLVSVAPDLRVCDGSPDNPGDGSDTYAITLFPDDTITVEYSNVPSNESLKTMQLTGPNSCNEPAASDSTTPGKLTHTVQGGGGTYYLKVGFGFGQGAIPYDLDMKIDEGPPCNDNTQFEQAGNDAPYGSPAEFVSLDRQNIIDGGDDASVLEEKICVGDVDAYCIPNVQQNDKLEFQVKFDDPPTNLDAYVRDPSGTQVASSTSNDSNETVVVPSQDVTQSGKYCITVQGNGPQRGDYDLLAFVNNDGPKNPQCPDRFEANDTCSSIMSCEAVQISPGTESDLLSCSGNADWYETQVGPGETIDVDATTSGSGSLTVDVYSEDSLTTPVATSTGGPASYTSNKTQTVYYRVTTSSSRVFYDLDVSISGPSNCSDDRLESPGNDTAGTATSATVPGQILNLKKCDGNEDWYEVTLNDGELFQVNLLHDSQDPDPTVDTGDLDIELYEAASGGGSPTMVASSTTMSDPETLQYTYSGSDAQKTHYVKVVSPNNARLDYDLRFLLDTSGDGTIDSSDNWPAGSECPDQFEENDTPNDATDVAGKQYTGLSMCGLDDGSGTVSSDDDYYTIFVPNTVTLDVTVSQTSTTQVGQLDVDIFDGDPSGSGTSVANGTADNMNDASLSVTNSGSGKTYYVKVAASGGTFLADYSLDLQPSYPMSCTEDSLGNIDASSSGTGTAKTLSSGIDYDGSNGLKLCENTEDWFEFTPTVDGTATFGLSHKGALGGISIEILDSSGNTVGSVSSPFSTSNVKEATASVTAGNTYNVRVYPTGGAFLRNDYDLWASLPSSSPSEPWCPDQYERNDESSPDIAYSLTQSDLQWDDAISCGTEEDWYTVQLSSNTTYYFDVFFDHSSSDDVDMEVRDSSGNLVNDDNTGNAISFANSSSDDDEQAVYTTGSSGGTYRVGFKKSSTSEVLAPFEIVTSNNFSSGSGCTNDRYEPNNNPGQYKPLENPNPTMMNSDSDVGSLPYVEKLTMCSDGDDRFSWTPSTSGTVELEALLNSSQHQLGIQVFDGSGSIVMQDSSTGSDNRVGGTFAYTSGTTYDIYVYPGLVGGNNAYGPYFLRLQEFISTP
jgi:hypothetical protein